MCPRHVEDDLAEPTIVDKVSPSKLCIVLWYGAGSVVGGMATVGATDAGSIVTYRARIEYGHLR
jgi:hypothetical protein